MHRIYQVGQVQLAFEKIPEMKGLGDEALCSAVSVLANQELDDANGAVYTRSEVVDFILDLLGTCLVSTFAPSDCLNHHLATVSF